MCVCVHKGFYVVKHNINLKIFYPKKSSDFACINFFYAFVSITSWHVKLHQRSPLTILFKLPHIIFNASLIKYFATINSCFQIHIDPAKTGELYKIRIGLSEKIFRAQWFLEKVRCSEEICKRNNGCIFFHE